MQPTATQQSITQIAQSRPSGTSAVTFVDPLDKSKFIVYTIFIANTTGGAVSASLFYDADGTTHDQTTALLYAKSIAANDYIILEFRDGIPLQGSGTLGAQTSSADALTFTALGVELGQSGTGF